MDARVISVLVLLANDVSRRLRGDMRNRDIFGCVVVCDSERWQRQSALLER